MENIRNELHTKLMNNVGPTGSGDFPKPEVADNISKSIDEVVGTDLRELLARVIQLETRLTAAESEIDTLRSDLTAHVNDSSRHISSF